MEANYKSDMNEKIAEQRLRNEELEKSKHKLQQEKNSLKKDLQNQINEVSIYLDRVTIFYIFCNHI